jgi:hypothetical protein
VVLDASTVKSDTQEILKLHSIPFQASEDMLDLLPQDSPAPPQNGTAAELSPV